MARIGRIVFFTAFIAVIATAAWVQFTTQSTRADSAATTSASVAAVFDSVVQAENAARDHTVVHDQATLDAYTASRTRLTRAITDARDAVDDRALREQLDGELALVDAWIATVDQDVAAATTTGTGTADGTDAARAAARGEQLTKMRVANDALLRALDRHDRDERDSSGMHGLLVVVGCCVFFAALNWGLFLRSERRESAIRDRQMAFADRLPTARSEGSVRTMLARHLELVAPGTMVLVTGPDDTTPTGRPVMSGGERVATVIIRAERDLTAPVERLVHDSILRAGPVLGTLRLLAHAQERAATDPLTGLGNRRLVEDALERMVAHTRRTGERFAVAVLDLDHFKPVNDTHGHAAGDALLVAVAGVLDDTTREYDIVGRLGGDEFIVLLTGPDSIEAVTVMERCRAAIADLRVGTPPLGVTASIGVTPSGPTLLGDAAALLRAADDAVYVAKARGGNCVVVGKTTDASSPQASALRA